MKNLVSKEHYCFKIHALLMKSSACLPFIDNPLYELPLAFTTKSSMIFQIFQTPYKYGSVHTIFLNCLSKTEHFIFREFFYYDKRQQKPTEAKD